MPFDEKVLYDAIGKAYSLGRRADPRIEAQIRALLSGARAVLNLGAGAGSYEPHDLPLTAVEPSGVMIRQRPSSAAPVVKATAEALPFETASFSHGMTVLSMHHWRRRELAFAEIRRVVSERFVAVTWDPEVEPFWLTRDYFPQIHEADRKIFPTMSELARAFRDRADGYMEIVALPIPFDCVDGFLGAFWRRPEAYLDPRMRANTSAFAKCGDVDEGLSRLRRDLESGEWSARNEELLALDAYDMGYRLVRVDF